MLPAVTGQTFNCHWIQINHVQTIPRTMVCVRIWRDQIVSLYLYDGNATGETYLHILRAFFMDLLYDVPLLLKCNTLLNKTGHLYILR
jgi:hypothetical protein